MTNKISYTVDTLVVGASLSGSVSAFILGKAGVSVALVDPQPFPRQKACGEGLSALGQSYLKQLGLWTEALDRASVPLFGYSIKRQDGSTVSLVSRSDAPQCFGVSRVSLDSHVLESARCQPSVSFVNDKVVSLEPWNGEWLCRTSNGTGIQARSVILGVGGKGFQFLSDEPASSHYADARFGLAFWCKGGWNNGRPSVVQIVHQPEGQYFITPISEDTVNISVLLQQSGRDIPAKGEMKRRGLELLRSAGFEVREVSDTRGAGEVHALRRVGHSSLYLVGDAIERFDPVGGMGMTHAVLSAALAAASVLEGRWDPGPALRKYYSARWRAARILRLLSELSYELNVAENWAVLKLVRCAPRFSLWVTSFLRKCVPSLPRVVLDARSLGERPFASESQLPSYSFSLAIQESRS
ncbi:MAG: FAD-dependent monooxygenase [Bdellovibrionales bacterium]|nr:FAD-dependent monooxygenase [Bdellovibrionales bacterium]